MGAHHTPARRLRILGGAVGVGLILASLFGVGFSIGEAQQVVDERTVVEQHTPRACLDALDAASEALALTGEYDNEMRTLHQRDGGVHIFTPGGDHDRTAQTFHREFTAARTAFTAAAETCREVDSHG